MRGAVLGIRFLLELGLLCALAAGGWALAGGGVLGGVALWAVASAAAGVAFAVAAVVVAVLTRVVGEPAPSA